MKIRGRAPVGVVVAVGVALSLLGAAVPAGAAGLYTQSSTAIGTYVHVEGLYDSGQMAFAPDVPAESSVAVSVFRGVSLTGVNGQLTPFAGTQVCFVAPLFGPISDEEVGYDGCAKVPASHFQLTFQLAFPLTSPLTAAAVITPTVVPLERCATDTTQIPYVTTCAPWGDVTVSATVSGFVPSTPIREHSVSFNQWCLTGDFEHGAFYDGELRRPAIPTSPSMDSSSTATLTPIPTWRSRAHSNRSRARPGAPTCNKGGSR